MVHVTAQLMCESVFLGFYGFWPVFLPSLFSNSSFFNPLLDDLLLSTPPYSPEHTFCAPGLLWPGRPHLSCVTLMMVIPSLPSRVPWAAADQKRRRSSECNGYEWWWWWSCCVVYASWLLLHLVRGVAGPHHAPLLRFILQRLTLIIHWAYVASVSEPLKVLMQRSGMTNT